MSHTLNRRLEFAGSGRVACVLSCCQDLRRKRANAIVACRRGDPYFVGRSEALNLNYEDQRFELLQWNIIKLVKSRLES